MNNQRRKQIADLEAKLEQIKEALEVIYDEEQEALENVPEKFQETDRHYEAQEKADILDEVAQEIEALIERLQEAAE